MVKRQFARWVPVLSIVCSLSCVSAATVSGSGSCRTQIDGAFKDCISTINPGDTPPPGETQYFVRGETLFDVTGLSLLPTRAEASYAVRGSYGYVGALAITEAVASRTQTGGGFLTVYAESRSQASFSDRIQVLSTTLSTGTEVWLTFSVRVRGGAESFASMGSGARATLVNQYLVNTPDPIAAIYCAGDVPAGACSEYLFNDDKLFVHRRQARIGDTFDLTMSIEALAMAGTGTTEAYPAGSAGARVAFVETAYARVNAESPEVLLVSESGFDYTSAIPVPEPATYALMLAGTGALALGARRRRRCEG